jgi:hypothetical protein
MRGAIPPLSQYVFMAWCLVKHRDNFTIGHCMCLDDVWRVMEANLHAFRTSSHDAGVNFWQPSLELCNKAHGCLPRCVTWQWTSFNEAHSVTGPVTSSVWPLRAKWRAPHVQHVRPTSICHCLTWHVWTPSPNAEKPSQQFLCRPPATSYMSTVTVKRQRYSYA